MRWPALIALLVLPGCTDPAPAEDSVFAGDIDVPAGQTGFVDFILDTDREASWTWQAEHDVRARWQMRCPGGVTETGPTLTARAGGDGAVGKDTGCKVSLFWGPATSAMQVDVQVVGSAVGVTTGVED